MEKVAPPAPAEGLPTEPALRKIRIPFLQRGIDTGAYSPDLPLQTVHATRDKRTRAQPVATLYEQGKVKHAGVFPALEDEMCDFGLDGLSSGRSPDRVDALVWALTALCLGAKGEPRVRGL